MNRPLSHCEFSDTYTRVIYSEDRFRVIICTDEIQWILQKRAGTRHDQPRWDPIGYFITREALVRVWSRVKSVQDAEKVPTELLCLPEKFKRGTNG